MKKVINLNNANQPWHVPVSGESAMAKFTRVASKLKPEDPAKPNQYFSSQNFSSILSKLKLNGSNGSQSKIKLSATIKR